MKFTSKLSLVRTQFLPTHNVSILLSYASDHVTKVKCKVVVNNNRFDGQIKYRNNHKSKNKILYQWIKLFVRISMIWYFAMNKFVVFQIHQIFESSSIA